MQTGTLVCMTGVIAGRLRPVESFFDNLDPKRVQAPLCEAPFGPFRQRSLTPFRIKRPQFGVDDDDGSGERPEVIPRRQADFYRLVPLPKRERTVYAWMTPGRESGVTSLALSLA